MAAKGKLPKGMFPGLVGRIVDTFAPYTEAAGQAVGVQFLVALGNVVGRSPHFYIGETRHGLNENVVVVGKTSRARKGDGLNVALRALRDADPAWSANVTGGLSSGEGLIYAVRDAVEKAGKDGEPPAVVDPGVEDKRLLVVETEFANALKVITREANTLSCKLRETWDGVRVLRTLTKNSPLRATDAHVSIIAHATPEDLTEHLADVEVANGFANRFLFVLTDRTRLLPEPKRVPENVIAALVKGVQHVLAHAQTITTPLQRSPKASQLWREIYPTLSVDHPGLIGSLLARSEAHVARLSALYALLDQSKTIDVEHLESALALWDFVEASTRTIFANRTGSDAADRIRAELLPGQSLALSEIREQIFANHISAGRLADALKLLVKLEEITITTDTATGGRPRQIVTRRAAAKPAAPDESRAAPNGDQEEANP